MGGEGEKGKVLVTLKDAVKSVETISDPERLTKRKDIIDFYASVDMLMAPEMAYDFEYERQMVNRVIDVDDAVKRAEQEKDLYLVLRDSAGKIVAAGKASVKDEAPKEAYFSYAVVERELRGEAYMTKLFNAREGWAKKEKHCDRITAEIKTNNVSSLRHAFKNDLQVVGMGDVSKQDSYGVGIFILAKELSDASAEGDTQNISKGTTGLSREILLSDLAEIKDLLDKDFVGYELKPVGDKTDLSIENWRLVMKPKAAK